MIITPFFKTLFGLLAVAIGLLGFIPYFWTIFKGKTKPHAFSWLIWAVMTGIAFSAQILDGAGSGAWVTGVTTFATFGIFLISLRRGEKEITKSDALSLIGSALALLLWKITNDPLSAVILVVVIDTLGYFPTVRKSYHKPDEETVLLYFSAGLKYVFALLALEHYSLVTVLFPAYLTIANTLFVVMLLMRRSVLKIS